VKHPIKNNLKFNNIDDLSIEHILFFGAKELGIYLSDYQISQFKIFLNELKEWGNKIGLTSIREDRDIVIKHFLDSLTPIFLIRSRSSVIDLGSGAGFPSIPLKIVDPSLNIISIDSSYKKVVFQKQIVRLLKMNGIKIVRHRIENGPFNEIELNPDIVISRALANFKKALCLSKLYLGDKSRLILMLGKNISIFQLLNFSKSLDLKIDFIIPINLPFLGHKRNIVSFSLSF
jgi:16S rRNA (guanine527-N7)-methyltransferase